MSFISFYLFYRDKDNQIAVFQKSALEMEKLLAESKSEKLRHMEEAFQAKKKATELETRQVLFLINSKYFAGILLLCHLGLVK